MPSKLLTETMHDLVCLAQHCNDKEQAESFAKLLHGRLKQYSDKVDEALTHMLPAQMGGQVSLPYDQENATPLLVQYNRLTMIKDIHIAVQ